MFNAPKAFTRKRRAAAVSVGALVALTGALLSATSANAAQQTLDPANALYPASAPRIIYNQGQTLFTIADDAGKPVQIPNWFIPINQTHDVVFPADPNNINGDLVPTGVFYYVPSTHQLVDVGEGLYPLQVQATPGATDNDTSELSDPNFYNHSVATSFLESLAPGTEYDVIIGATPFAADGSAGDPSVLTPTEKYYSLPAQYNGLNPATGVYETGAVGSTPNAPVSTPAADTTTVITAVANAAGGVDLTATVKDTSGKTDTTASGTVTFSAGSVSATATVTNGVALATIAHSSSLPYSTAFSFTGVYSGDTAFKGSTSAAVPVTTAAEQPFLDQKTVDETVTIPAPDAGTIKLSVASGSVAFGQAKADATTGNFTATAALPTTTVADTRFAKQAWTLNGSSSDLQTADKANTITADHLSWTAPTVAGTAGATAGTAASSLATDHALAKFAAATIQGEADTTVTTTLGLTVPETQAKGDYSGKLTVTLVG